VDQGLLLQFKGPSVIQWGARAGSVGNPGVEGSVSLNKDMLQFFRLRYCGYEIEMLDQKYIRIYSNGQAAVKALQATKTMSPLVRQC